MIVYAQGDITKFDVDAIVNASNGFGYMGGKRCVNELHRGVAAVSYTHLTLPTT